MVRAPQVCLFLLLHLLLLLLFFFSFVILCCSLLKPVFSDSALVSPMFSSQYGLAQLFVSNFHLHLFTGAICQIVPSSNCRGYFRNFYFNLETNACESIIAGGCHPSGWNGFTTMEDCNRTCSGKNTQVVQSSALVSTLQQSFKPAYT